MSKTLIASLFLTGLLAAGCGRSSKSAHADGDAALPPGAVPVAATAVPAARTSPPAPSPDVKMGPLSFAPVAKSADPSVVTISTVGGDDEDDGLFSRGRRSSRTTKGLGTGFIVRTEGQEGSIILTNNHVVEGASRILVKLSNGRTFPASVAGRDPRTDIAVLRAANAGDEKDLPAIALGDSDGLEVGDWVVAIGNPFGLDHTVSAGIVSAKGRNNEDVPLDPTGYYNFIQTDASINPGNSGGPLLNLDGHVVGMNTAIRGGGAQGIGFAIPINMVKQILPPLLRDGHLTRSAIGVAIADVRQLTPEDKAELKLGDGDVHGAVVLRVDPSGPAAKAGLEQGDLIIAFESQPIERSSLLQWLASTAGVGKAVTLRVVRQGKTFDQSVTLGPLKETKAPRMPSAPRPRPPLGQGDEPY